MLTPFRRFGALSWGATLLLAAACSSADDAQPPHVVVILVDTLRVDHTGFGGYERDTTPGLDDLVGEGVVFDSHFANAPWTKPSVASILTGLLPPTHGCQWGDFERSQEGRVDLLASGFTTLPEVLRDHGWSTVALMTNEVLNERMGFDQGFDRYDMLGTSLDYDRAVAKAAVGILDEAKGPTFVWCHLMAPHEYATDPERAPSFESEHRTPIRPEQSNGAMIRDRYGMMFREQARDTYDETLLFVDEVVSELVRDLRERHPDCLIVFTSDHGEELGDHGGYLHSQTLFNELLRVPLVLWGPGVPAGTRVAEMTHSVDLFPTVLELLGLPPVPSQGRSLFDRGEREEEVYAEKLTGHDAKRALIDAGGKLIEHKPPGTPGQRPDMSGKGQWFYFADPLGPEDLRAKDTLAKPDFSRRRERLVELRKACLELHERLAAGSATQGVLTEEDLEALRRLGYAE